MACTILPDLRMPADPSAAPTNHGLAVRRGARRVLAWLAALALVSPAAQAVTYTSASTSYRLIDSSTHSKIGYKTSPYKFNASSGCGTAPPTLDDTLSDAIPIGFTFRFGATAYTSAYVMSNGRLQFGNTLCGSGTNAIGPPQTYPYTFPNSSANAVMKIFGVDLDPTNLVDVPNYPSSSKKTPCASSATCYVSVATLGTAPTRQFVVTWKNVPEWVSASNTSGSFDLQIILNEDGSFVFQFGTISHGGTGTAEIGWQLSTSDYQVLKFGAASEPPPNSAIAFYIPSAVLGTWALDEGAWAPGGEGQVMDGGAKLLHGKALGNAQAIPGGKLCRGADIPLNTTGGEVDAIQLGAALSNTSLNLQGIGSLAFWYKARAAWAGGTPGQLVDAATKAGDWFSLTRTASGTLAFVVTDSAGTAWTAETGAQSVAAGTWVHIAVAWNFNANPAANQDALTIFVNGTPTTVQFTSAGSVAGSAGFIHLGDNPIGSAHAKGSVNSADGVIDEVQLYNYVLTAAQVGALMATTRSCATLSVDHLEIQHATGTGLTCTPTVVTVKACANAACSSVYTSGVRATLTATGSISTGFDPSSTFTIGAGTSSATLGVQIRTPGSMLLGTTSPSITVTGATTCNFGSPRCTLSAVDAGLVISVPDHAAETVASLSVGAVRKSDNAQACVPAFANVTKSITFNCDYTNPASSSVPLRVGGTPLNAAGNGAAACDAGGRPVAVSFNASGVGSVSAQYADVGQLSVTGRYTSVSGADAGVTMQGSTSFVVAPASFTFSGVTPGPITAGGAFAATVTARNAAGGTTSNFGREAVPEGVTLSWVRRSPTGSGAVNGSFSGSVGAFSAGAAGGSNLVWTEVGSGDLVATLTSGRYLGSGLTATGTTGSGGAVGPFRPYRLSTSAGAACGSFTYGGQSFPVTVRALNTLGNVTANYDGSGGTSPSWARAVTLSEGSGNTRGTLTGSVTQGSFTAGVGVGSAVYAFTSKPTAPQTLTLRATDTDSISSAGGTESSSAQRSGRLRVANAFGAAGAALQLPVLAEYFSGAAWVLNSADTCTTVPAAAVALSNYRTGTGAATAAWSTSASAVALTAGYGTLRLAAPSAGGTGTVDVALNLGASAADQSCLANHPGTTGAAIAWLRSRNGSCATTWDRDPAARASFGVFSAETSRTVHARELF